MSTVTLRHSLSAFFLTFLCCFQAATGQLSVTYGTSGLRQLKYGGTVLEDTTQFGGDIFHIWHMKVTDLYGNVLSGPSDGWGENSTSKSWDSSAQAWTYQFGWGSIRCQFVQAGDILNVVITETNSSNSGVVLDGAAIYPLALHFPSLPSGFVNAAYPQLSYNTTGPSALLANYGTSEVAAVVADATKPLYSGFWPTGGSTPSYSLLVSGTTPDGLATFQPHNDRPVQPGQTDTFTVSLRFAGPTVPLQTLAADAYVNWGRTWPAQLAWNDRRIIGTAYLASSPQGSNNIHQPGGFPNNPRRYFNNDDPNVFDVRNVMGLAKFQTLVLQRAQDVVTNLRRMNAQGVITWDVEGEEYPQDTTYVCSPDQIATEAPEMETVISDPATGFAGQKLDDAYFRIITSAGFKVGVCVRPQHFAKASDGSAQQIYLSVADVEAEMRTKIQYAHDRWGATLFYLDSTVTADGGVLDAAIFQRLAAAFPDSLLIPEESSPKHYAYTAPFMTFLFHGDLGTDSQIYSYYPHAFSSNLINDVDALKLAAAIPQLVASVAAGDILMAHADYWDPNNSTVVGIYEAAAGIAQTPVTTPPVTTPPATTPPATTPPATTLPVTTEDPSTTTDPSTPNSPSTTPSTPTSPSTPSITSPSTSSSVVLIQNPGSGATISGTIPVLASIAVSLDAAGSYLMVDGIEIGTARVTSAPFAYALNTATLPPGTHTLQVWAHTTSNTVVLSDPITITVSGDATSNSTASGASSAGIGTGTPSTTTSPTPSNPLPAGPIAITFPASGQAISGTVSVAASIVSQLDAAGSYLLVDGQQYGVQRAYALPYLYSLGTSALSSGVHTLQVWAHTTSNETLISPAVSVTVAP